MPVKIRLMRIGSKKRPFYRVVAVDERRKRTGGYLELLGTYNPLTNPKEINLKQDLIDKWMKNGAVASDGFLRIIGKAKQRPERKPKNDKGSSAPAAEAAAPAEESTPTEDSTPAEEAAPVEETPTEETPAEAPAAEAPVEEAASEEVAEVPAEETPAQENTEETK